MGSSSISRAILPVRSAAKMVVPLPPNGSRMTPLRLLQSRIRSAMSATGFTVQVALTGRVEAIDARVVKNVCAIASLAPEPKIIDMRGRAVFERCDQLVFGAVEAAL